MKRIANILYAIGDRTRSPPATKNEPVALLCMNEHKQPECTRFDTMEVHPKEIRYESNH
jgi:hypothetical protein